jgi:hypothetical protein
MALAELVNEFPRVCAGDDAHREQAQGELLTQQKADPGAGRVAAGIGKVVDRPIQVLNDLPERQEPYEDPEKANQRRDASLAAETENDPHGPQGDIGHSSEEDQQRDTDKRPQLQIAWHHARHLECLECRRLVSSRRR